VAAKTTLFVLMLNVLIIELLNII